MEKIYFFSLFLYCFTSFAQIIVVTLTPDFYAQLDVFFSNKGVLLPRITLTGNIVDSK